MPVISARGEVAPQAPVQPQAPVRQPDTTEVPQTAPAEAKKDEQFSPKFAALAKKERVLRQQMRTLEAERQAFKAKETEVQSYVGLRDKFAQNPLAALSELGITYDQLTEAALNQPAPEDPKLLKLQQEIQAVKGENAKILDQFQQAQKNQYDQAVKQISNDVNILVDTDAQYETIKEQGLQDAVVHFIEDTFQKKGIVLSAEEACAKIEDRLVSNGLQMADLKKVQAKLQERAAQAQAEVKQVRPGQNPIQKQPVPTLTNQTAQVTRPLTRVERAKLAFEGKLK